MKSKRIGGIEEPCLFLDQSLCEKTIYHYLDTLSYNDEIHSKSEKWVSDSMLYLELYKFKHPDVSYGYWENNSGINYNAFRYNNNGLWKYGWLEIESYSGNHEFKKVVYQR